MLLIGIGLLVFDVIQFQKSRSRSCVFQLHISRKWLLAWQLLQFPSNSKPHIRLDQTRATNCRFTFDVPFSMSTSWLRTFRLRLALKMVNRTNITVAFKYETVHVLSITILHLTFVQFKNQVHGQAHFDR